MERNPKQQAFAEPKSDLVLPFSVNSLNVNGKVAFLDSTVSAILNKHNYPVPVSKLVAEGIILTTLLGVSLKSDGQMILQTQTDGPVSLVVVNYRAPGKLRAYVKFDADAVEKFTNSNNDHLRQGAKLLGKGHLALTVDHGEYSKRYQGLVALDDMTFEEAALQYFEQSEQIPTCIKMSVGEMLIPKKGKGQIRSWTAGGIIVQNLPELVAQAQPEEIRSEEANTDNQDLKNSNEDAWIEAQALIKTVTDAELSLPDLTAEQLLLRLFHQHELRVFPTQSVKNECQCNRHSIKSMLANFENQERSEMIKEGKICVVCEFCSAKYDFKPIEFEN